MLLCVYFANLLAFISVVCIIIYTQVEFLVVGLHSCVFSSSLPPMKAIITPITAIKLQPSETSAFSSLSSKRASLDLPSVCPSVATRFVEEGHWMTSHQTAMFYTNIMYHVITPTLKYCAAICSYNFLKSPQFAWIGGTISQLM